MTTAREQLASMGYTIDSADDALDPSRHEFHPCTEGHFDCARTKGGKCLGGLWAVLSAAKAEQEDEEYAAAHADPTAELIAALQDLVTRCDGDEGVRADGSNIQTIRAHAVLAKLGKSGT